MIENSDEENEEEQKSNLLLEDPNLVTDKPELRISHNDVGKLDDMERDSEFGGASIFDIEGEDDTPPDLAKQDLRKFRYGVF